MEALIQWFERETTPPLKPISPAARPEVPPPSNPNNCGAPNFSKKLLASFYFCSDQPDLVNSRATHDINRPGNFSERNVVFSLDEGNFLRALLKYSIQPRPQVFPSHIVLVNFHFAVG